MALWVSLANGPVGSVAEDVQGVGADTGGAEVGAGVEGQAGRVDERDRVAAAHVDVHHLVAEGVGVDRQRADVAGRVDDVGRRQIRSACSWAPVLDKVKSWLTTSAEASTVRSVNPKSLSTVTGPRMSARLPKIADQDRVLARLPVDVERAVGSGRLDERRVVAEAGVQAREHG